MPPDSNTPFISGINNIPDRTKGHLRRFVSAPQAYASGMASVPGPNVVSDNWDFLSCSVPDVYLTGAQSFQNLLLLLLSSSVPAQGWSPLLFQNFTPAATALSPTAIPGFVRPVAIFLNWRGLRFPESPHRCVFRR